LAFSPDGKRFAAGSTSGTEAGAIQFWDVQTGRPLQTVPNENVEALAFSPDGTTLATSGHDPQSHTIKFWDVNTGQLLRTLRDEKGFIIALAFHPNGNILASGNSESTPSTIRLWDVQTGDELRTLTGEVETNTLAFSPDGQYLAVAGGLRVWNLAEVLSADFSTDALVEKPLLPEIFPPTVLLQNYPNPFQPHDPRCGSGTRIPFLLGEDAQVVLTIYNLLGRTVREFSLGHLAAGDYRFPLRAVRWDGRNDLGEAVTSGVYFYSLEAGDFRATRKMVLKK
ncbi:MAG: T9SS type A sorting domain-containing protein, partial [Candidatus Poribacteria bacterium]|nr:T9SS type A sorting domain-containing protein [Candidatus Poribacteria bacterium]